MRVGPSLLIISALLSLAVAPASPLAFSVQDTNGRTFTVADLRSHKATVLIFVATDCPNSNTYIPLLARMHREYSGRGVQFLSVYSDASETVDIVRKHDAEFQVPYPALLDPHQVLARMTGARSTPEVVILGPEAQQFYRGRVDDRFVDFGKTRYQPTQSDLRDALDKVLQGKPVVHPITKVLGCAIPGVN